LDHLDLEHAIDEAEEVYQQQQQAREVAVADAAAASSARKAEDQRKQLQDSPSHRQHQQSPATVASTSNRMHSEATHNSAEQLQHQQQQQQEASDAHTDLQTPDHRSMHRGTAAMSNGDTPHVMSGNENGSQKLPQQYPSHPLAPQHSPTGTADVPSATASASTAASGAAPLEAAPMAAEAQTAPTSGQHSGDVGSTHVTSSASPSFPPSTSDSDGPHHLHSQQIPEGTSAQPHWADLDAVYFATNADGAPLNLSVAGEEDEEPVPCMLVFEVIASACLLAPLHTHSLTPPPTHPTLTHSPTSLQSTLRR